MPKRRKMGIEQDLIELLSPYGEVDVSEVERGGVEYKAGDVRFVLYRSFLTGGVMGRSQFVIPLYDYQTVRQQIKRAIREESENGKKRA